MARITAVIILAALTYVSSYERREHHYDIRGKIALITGGNRGIGLSITTELLTNGVKGVTMIGVNADKGKQAVDLLSAKFGSGKVISLVADVSNAKQLEEAFNASFAHWGGLDIVINNAGVVDENNPTTLVNINAVGVVQGTLLGMKLMSVGKGGRGGVIINVSSIYGIDPILVSPVYSGTKAFVIGFSRAMGTQVYYDYNKVRIVTLCPGVTDTDLLSKEPFIRGISEEFKPNLKEISYENLQKTFKQAPEYLGKAAIVLIKNGASGSVWVSEDEHPPYEVEFPNRQTMKKPKKLSHAYM